MNKSDLDDINEILNFGALFSGRLDAEMLKGALDYVHFNECKLSLETLLDYICEYDVNITESEYATALSLAKSLNIERCNTIAYLKNLIE